MYTCAKCGIEVKGEIAREMAEDPEMVVICDDCAYKIWKIISQSIVK